MTILLAYSSIGAHLIAACHAGAKLGVLYVLFVAFSPQAHLA